MTVTVTDQEAAQRFAELTAATEGLIAAEGAYFVALAIDAPLAAESRKLAAAELNHDRALLAVQLANRTYRPGQRRLVLIARKSDGDWIPRYWGAFDARPGETATGQALRHAVEHSLIGTGDTWRVLVWTDPRPGAEHDAEWNSQPQPAEADRCGQCGARNPFGTPCAHSTSAPEPDTRAMPNGTELLDEHWNARLLREEKERANGEPPSAAPVTFLTLALDRDGNSLRMRHGVLLFDACAAEVGAWACEGVGYDTSIPAWDHLTARRWVTRILDERGRKVIGWQMYRDSLGTFWLPTIAGGKS